jgi:hypothetical protein
MARHLSTGTGDLDQLHLKRFRSLRLELQLAVERGTELEAHLSRQMALHSKELRELANDQSTGRLGAKRKIAELVDELSTAARARLTSRGAKGGELEVHYVSFMLDSKCPGCGAWVSDAMNFCPICAQATRRPRLRVPFLRERTKYLKKNAKGIPSCMKCYAPSEAGFSYCYNCGVELDLFGLKAAIDLARGAGPSTKAAPRSNRRAAASTAHDGGVESLVEEVVREVEDLARRVSRQARARPKPEFVIRDQRQGRGPQGES